MRFMQLALSFKHTLEKQKALNEEGGVFVRTIQLIAREKETTFSKAGCLVSDEKSINLETSW